MEQVVRGAAEPVEADHAVGGEVGAVLGDEVEHPGAAGAGGADEPDGAAAGQQPDEPFALVLTAQQGRRGPVGSRGRGRPGGAVGLGAGGGGAADGPLGAFGGRAELDLTAVDGVDGDEVLAGHEAHHADR